ncbi:MAG: ABC transporter permease [Rhizobiales bacterium]|nr:ABC transporter permease [Hyphomicrobiales bacterium]MBN9010767.1 ABC transporter permease [Hyphomicrobiales bacterium]
MMEMTGSRPAIRLDPVTALLALAGLAAALLLPFLGLAPNRILSPQPYGIAAAIQPGWLTVMIAGFLLVVAGAVLAARRSDLLVLAGATVVLLAAFASAGDAATRLTAEAASPATRVSLGAAFWILFATSALAMVEALRRLGVGQLGRILYAAAIVAILALLASRGWFDDLSIIREWANRRDQFAAAVSTHLLLVVVSLAVSLAIGLPLGIWTALRARAAGPVFAMLNIIQTIPSIALFGLLIGPLTALSNALPALRTIGIGGIGFAPAVIALVLYGLLPIARNTQAGLLSVPASVTDAARGMGLTPRQVVTSVSLPLALPSLLAGLRIVTIQTIGMGVVAALIGAGGLGSFVFLGLGQTAIDLVLLGALSTIALALAADALLSALSLLATRRMHR